MTLKEPNSEPTRPARWRTATLQLAPILLAPAAWLSLSPYFAWGSTWADLVGGVVAALVTLACLAVGQRPSWRSLEGLGFVLILGYLVLITVEPRLDGGHTRWIFVIPTLTALWVLSAEQRRRCFNVFAAIFAITLVPAILDSVWLAAGLPQTFTERAAPNAAMAAQGVRLLTSPWALFIESNGQILPWGGVLFRMSSIYDEPGTVGTIAALLLAALNFRARDLRVGLLYAGGFLSFSLAFVVLTSIGLLAHAVIHRRPDLALAIVPALVAASLALGFAHMSNTVSAATHISVVRKLAATSAATPQPGPPPTQTEHFTPVGPGLRQTQQIDNRSLPGMNALFRQYLHSGPRVLLLGVATDASVVRGGASQVWTRVLTDSGIVGFCLLFGGAALIALAAWRRSSYSLDALVFLGLYAMNIYQRPVIWLPYALLILVCGAAMYRGQPVPSLSTSLRRKTAATPSRAAA